LHEQQIAIGFWEQFYDLVHRTSIPPQTPIPFCDRQWLQVMSDYTQTVLFGIFRLGYLNSFAC
jgi:hypothetical protein